MTLPWLRVGGEPNAQVEAERVVRLLRGRGGHCRGGRLLDGRIAALWAMLRAWTLSDRMRVMFASPRGAGHLGPILPLADACKRAGHHVLIAGPGSLSACVARSGHAFWQLDDAPADELAAAWASARELPGHERNGFVIREVFARLNVLATLPRHRSACREWRP